MKRRAWVAVTAVVLTTLFVGSVGDAWARVRVGGGSRGSRSFSAPHVPLPSVPSAPRTSAAAVQPSAPAVQPVPVPGFFQSLGGAMAGYALGGFLGGVVFGGAGRGFSVGALDVLVACAVLLVVWQVLKRRSEAKELAVPGVFGSNGKTAATLEMPSVRHGNGDVDGGLARIRRTDPGYDAAAFTESARTFFKIMQSAIAIGDVGIIRNRLTPQMYGALQAQCHELRVLHRTEYGVNPELSRVELSDAWQDSGQDFVTIAFGGSMIQYIVDDTSGEVIKGSKTEPETLEESWIFTRTAGPGDWKLATIDRV